METITNGDFEDGRLAREPRTALVAFVADWCGFCRRFLRDAEPKSATLPVPFLAADVSEDADPLWDAFAVQVVPTIVLFKDGVPVWRKDGRAGIGLPRNAIEEARRAAESAGLA